MITLSVMSTAGSAEDRLLQDQVVLLGLEDLLDHPVGALDHARQLFVLALVQVFLELAALALQVAVLLDQLALAARALGLGQRRRVLVELVGGGLQAVAPGRSSSFSRLQNSASSLACAALAGVASRSTRSLLT